MKKILVTGGLGYIGSHVVVELQNNKFEVEIIGNGDNGFKFYFIPPFSNEIVSLNPDEIVITAGKTTAIFNKSNLAAGYWFFAFAENSSGKIIKSSSPREFNNGNVSSQTYSGNIETEILNFNINGRNVGGGEALSTNDSISISCKLVRPSRQSFYLSGICTCTPA